MSFPFRRTPDEFKRKTTERKTEYRRAKKENITSADYQNIKNKLGLNQRTSETKLKFVLNRYKKKPRSWKAIGITKEDFKRFGIEV